MVQNMSAARRHCALKPLQQLQPFYTGGSVCLCGDERRLVAACGEEAKVCAALACALDSARRH